MGPLNHLLIAWMIANAFPLDVRTRRFCLIAGVIPDIDGIPILFDQSLFLAVHHTFGHMLIFGILLSLVLALFLKRKILGFSVMVLAFAAHLGADIIGSSWGVPVFAPLLNESYSSFPFLSNEIIYGVMGPAFLVLGTLAMALILVKKRRTPMEFLSKRWDGILCDFFVLPFTETCHVCGAKASFRCEDCQRAVCRRHVTGDAKHMVCKSCG
jgi:membrane-bound metal-dependent hydrolase YbcI (DUF457 family)